MKLLILLLGIQFLSLPKGEEHCQLVPVELSGPENAFQSCELSAMQFWSLVRSNLDRQEEVLLPCFNKKENKYRRDYGPVSDGRFQYYDVVIVEEGVVTLHTLSPKTYIDLKTSLKKMGFKQTKNAEIYTFNAFVMVTSSSLKNKDGETSFFITIR